MSEQKKSILTTAMENARKKLSTTGDNVPDISSIEKKSSTKKILKNGAIILGAVATVGYLSAKYITRPVGEETPEETDENLNS